MHKYIMLYKFTKLYNFIILYLLIYLKSVFSGLRGKPVEGPRLHCQLRPRTPWYAILGTICGSKYNCIHPKAPCGTLFQFKIRFYPPKSSLRDAFPDQNSPNMCRHIRGSYLAFGIAV